MQKQTETKKQPLKMMSAGNSNDGKVTFALLQIRGKSYVHAQLDGGYVVYVRASEAKCVAVNNALADWLEERGIKTIEQYKDGLAVTE